MQTANKPSVEELRKLATETSNNSSILRIANHEPLPGPLYEAFGEEVIVVDGIEVRPVVAIDWAILKKLNSPVYRMSLESEKPKDERSEIDYTDEEGFELCYQFTRPAKESRMLINKGREVFRETANESIGDKWKPALVNKVVEAVTTQMKRCFDTAIKYQEPDSADDGAVKGPTRFFQEPPAAPQTG